MSSHNVVVQKLVDYLAANPPANEAFSDAFTLAQRAGLQQFQDFNIHSVSDYIRFMDDFVNWIPTEDFSGRNVYYHLCIFYFILDLPPIRDYQDPVDPAANTPPYRWMSQWLIDYAIEMGQWMSKPQSLTTEAIQSFAESPAYRDSPEVNFFDQYPVPPGGWKTFNEFFARDINPTFRPIASPDDPTVIVSPADCTFDGVWPINEDTADVTTFDVKGVPWVISQLLDDEASGTDYGQMFAGGTFTHSFLNATDYHRQHAPVSGKLLEARPISGHCYLEVVLKQTDGDKKSGGKPQLGMHRRIIPKNKDPEVMPHPATDSSVAPNAPDSPGYQFIQARALILIDSPIGKVAVLPIGMAQVSSVKINDSLKKTGAVITKGQEISHFEFGGSDIVMVFQKAANVQFNQDVGVHYKFGSAVATATKVAPTPPK